MPKVRAGVTGLCLLGFTMLTTGAASAGVHAQRGVAPDSAVPAFYPYPLGYALPVRPGALAPVVTGGYYYTGRIVVPAWLRAGGHRLVQP